jgi:hypothetical protein
MKRGIAMIKFYMRVLGILIDINIEFIGVKMPRCFRRTPIYEGIENEVQKEYNSLDEEEENKEEIPTVSKIQSQALRFEEELKNLGIYNIPDTSDIAPTYEIQDDVEIITDRFEKEQQDMIEDRRK